MTNQVDEDKHKERTWLGACFGAVAHKGYGKNMMFSEFMLSLGICYRFGGNHSIIAHITSYKSAENTDSTRFKQHFIDAVKEMVELFEIPQN